MQEPENRPQRNTCPRLIHGAQDPQLVFSVRQPLFSV
jgi:hypothetical protein